MTTLALLVLIKLQSITTRRDECGQTLAEYGLIISVIAVAVLVLAVVTFRDTLPIGFKQAANCMNAGVANLPSC